MKQFGVLFLFHGTQENQTASGNGAQISWKTNLHKKSEDCDGVDD